MIVDENCGEHHSARIEETLGKHTTLSEVIFVGFESEASKEFERAFFEVIQEGRVTGEY